MRIDYIYVFSPGFIAWLDAMKPGVTNAIRAAGIEPEGFEVAATVELDVHYRSVRHVLLLHGLGQVAGQSGKEHLDYSLEQSDPLLILELHPNELRPPLCSLERVDEVKEGDTVFISTDYAARIGLRLMPVTVYRRDGSRVGLEHAGGKIESVSTDINRLRLTGLYRAATVSSDWLAGDVGRFLSVRWATPAWDICQALKCSAKDLNDAVSRHGNLFEKNGDLYSLTAEGIERFFGSEAKKAE